MVPSSSLVTLKTWTPWLEKEYRVQKEAVGPGDSVGADGIASTPSAHASCTGLLGTGTQEGIRLPVTRRAAHTGTQRPLSPCSPVGPASCRPLLHSCCFSLA